MVWRLPSATTSSGFSPDGRTLATASSRVVRLWDVATGQSVTALTDPDSSVEELTFSPDGTTLATCADETVRLWDVATGDVVRTLAITDPDDKLHGVKFHGVAFSPDGKSVATTSTDKTVRLWDVASGKTTATFADDTIARDVAFSPDGTTLATASGDTVRLWKIDS
ncbi:hypothetical protein ABGB07_35165 [Micromonosporaceae bacterium B7E4]